MIRPLHPRTAGTAVARAPSAGPFLRFCVFAFLRLAVRSGSDFAELLLVFGGGALRPGAGFIEGGERL